MKSMLKSLMSVVVAALTLTSCSTDATDEVVLKGESKTLAVNATIDRTRTFMNTDDHRILEWSETDEIYLYIGTDATKANSINPKSGDKITATYENGNNVYAYYSTAVDGISSEGVKKVLLNIPSKQTQTAANAFAGENLPMVASGPIENGTVNLTFQPVGCVLVFNVYGQDTNEDEKIEKIKSIKFETSVKCCGNDICDLTEKTLGYTANGENNVTVTLDTPAAIGAAKPTDTKKGESQVYMVVAPAKYPAGSKFIVTTDKNNTYTFVTENGIDCSQNTARVVNLNLLKSEELKPSIKVPYVYLQSSKAKDEILISGINFTNIANELTPEKVLGVYGDAELTQPDVAWLQIRDNNAGLFESGDLYYCITEDNTTAEIRTAYIGIKCVGKDGKQVVQAAIPIRQVGEGCMVADVSYIVTEDIYQLYFNDDWVVTCGGGRTNKIASLGSDSNNVGKRNLVEYSAIAKAMGLEPSDRAAAVISNKAMPKGYNTVTLEYDSVVAKTEVGIAFSLDNENWVKIKDLSGISETKVAGSHTYKFPQQEAGYYAFVAKASAEDARITNCKITYSQQ